MADPGPYSITVYQRTDIVETFNLFSDVAKTIAFDLGNYTVKAVAIDQGNETIPGGKFDLVPTVVGDGSAGQITITKTAAEVITAGLVIDLPGESPKWDLIITNSVTGIVSPPVLQGSLLVKEVFTP